MKKSHLFISGLMPVIMLLIACGATLSKESLLDAVANLVIQKYENASCEQLTQMKPQSGEDSQAKQDVVQEKAMEMLRNNPEMREQFIDRVAGPIANKMFECNLVP